MTTATRSGLKTPLRAHQQLAFDSCVSHFLCGTPRVTITLPCGAGKTLVALNVVQATVPNGRSLVVMPTLNLLEQTAAVWHAERRPGLYLGMCSRPEPEDPQLSGAITMVATAEALTQQLVRADGPVNVFATYSSLQKIADAFAAFPLPRWDVLIADEAHRSAGNLGKAWALLHDDRAVPARHRLYMTATPRIFDPLKGTAARPECEVASMDDLSLYGPVVYRLSLAEAISQGLLADYRIVVIEIDDEDLRPILNRHSGLAPESEGLRVAAAQIALLRAQHTYDLRRTLTFHSRIATADMFAQTLAETAALMPPDTQAPLQAGTVNSRQSPFERRTAFSAFAQTPLNTAPTTDLPERAVLTNCRSCSEGVDVPAIDSILFADPKTSSIDIVQGVGRCLRQTPGDGKISTIILPVYSKPGQDIGEATKRTAFHTLYQVMIALSTYDEHFFHRVEFDRYPYEPEPDFAAARPERADEIIPLLSLNAADPHNSVWGLGFESAERFHAEHGHLNVPSRYLGPDRFYLGWWIGHQRSLRINGLLLQERIDTLDTLGMAWEHPPTSIEYKLKLARDYAARHGHLAPRHGERYGGMYLGRWIADRRREARSHSLPFCYQRALTEIDPWWNARWSRQWHRTYTQALAAARSGQLAFPDLRPDSDDSPLTRWLDEQIDDLFKLHPDQHNLLGALPLDHPLALLLRRPRGSAQWAFLKGLRAARAYWRSHQNLDVPYRYVDQDSYRLGQWISEKRCYPHQLTGEQLRALEALDMRWILRQRPLSP
ncbi:Helicase associated domain protein [Streptomyces sp. ISL-1]|uniref:DEAD/DEAH box helicase n=1 Tax=Streptomyces sp. ISL-1 TaxID=2817657 RepID=UPI001BE65A70|nr:DEAD/DEAH box helicase [Streptomyces sp. ISL-1]MBT2391453.1 Helicase associated domain protein [Streptomyces sp. ISL-1]